MVNNTGAQYNRPGHIPTQHGCCPPFQRLQRLCLGAQPQLGMAHGLSGAPKQQIVAYGANLACSCKAGWRRGALRQPRHQQLQQLLRCHHLPLNLAWATSHAPYPAQRPLAAILSHRSTPLEAPPAMG